MALAQAVSLALALTLSPLVAAMELAPALPDADGPASEDGDCLSALQTGPAFATVEAEAARPVTVGLGADDSEACEGPWCAMLTNFSRLFDSNVPWKMQKAFDLYSEYAKADEGIKLAVTKDHFYEMYHSNVGRKLSEYLPQGLFAWKFDGRFETLQQWPATVVRKGTITFNLGYWKRNMFWNAVIKSLPDGKVFPYSEVTKFDDCTKCPAKIVYTLKNGGLDGDATKGWKITSVTLIKLA